jgi:hypothetical protein
MLLGFINGGMGGISWKSSAWKMERRCLARYTIIPAATVSLVPGSMSTKEPVLRLRR